MGVSCARQAPSKSDRPKVQSNAKTASAGSDVETGKIGWPVPLFGRRIARDTRRRRSQASTHHMAWLRHESVGMSTSDGCNVKGDYTVG